MEAGEVTLSTSGVLYVFFRCITELYWRFCSLPQRTITQCSACLEYGYLLYIFKILLHSPL
jgi:hypothetical protein